MGWIHKGLEKANNLQGLAQNLENFALTRKRDKAKQKLQEIIAGALTGYDDLEQKQKQITTDFIPGIPGQTVGNIVPYPKFNQKYINTRNDEIRSDFINKLLTIEDIDDASLQKSMLMIDNLSSRFKKKPGKMFKLKEGESYIEQDEHGEIKEVFSSPKKKEVKPKKVGSYTNQDGYEVIIWDDGTETKSKEKVRKPAGQSITIEQPKIEKWKDFGKVINSIQYQEDENGKLVARDEESKNVQKNLSRNLAYAELTPGALRWYDKNIKKGGWKREDISDADFLTEIIEALEADEITSEDAQNLRTMAVYRPYLWDLDTKNYKVQDEKKKKKD